MADKEKSVLEVATIIHNELQPLNSEDRVKAISAAMILLGESQPGNAAANAAPDSQPVSDSGGAQNAKQFFESKSPNSKVEELVVAARHRELSGIGEEHQKADLEAVIKEARRNFDSKNFSRDMDNAKVAGLFNKNSGTGVFVLSYSGQNFVDALPNREEASKFKTKRKPKKKTATK